MLPLAAVLLGARSVRSIRPPPPRTQTLHPAPRRTSRDACQGTRPGSTVTAGSSTRAIRITSRRRRRGPSALSAVLAVLTGRRPGAQPATGIPRPAPEPVRMESSGHVALVFMPGVASFPKYTRFEDAKAEGQLALEFRGNDGGVSLSPGGRVHLFGKIGELSFKYDFFDGFFFRPFLGVGVGVASINPDASIRAAGQRVGGRRPLSGTRFLPDGEVRQRLFMEGTDGSRTVSSPPTGGRRRSWRAWGSTSSEARVRSGRTRFTSLARVKLQPAAPEQSPDQPRT